MKISRFRRGQTTVEYVLLTGLIALPLSILFVRESQKFLGGLLYRVISQFTFYGKP